MGGGGQSLSTAELLLLGVAPNEPRQLAPDGRLQVSPRRAGSRQLVKSPKVHGTRQLLQQRHEMRCLADGRAVRAEIVPAPIN
jgi:hypothetical protein